MKERKIQVSENLFVGLSVLLDILEDYDLDNTVAAICGVLREEVSKKQSAIERREAFTAYKSATPGEEREARRREYLEAIGAYGTGLSEREYPEEKPPPGF